MRSEITTSTGSVSIQHSKALSEDDVRFVRRIAESLAAGKRMRYERRIQEFMVAHGAREVLTHVDWKSAANEDAIDAVIGQMIAVAD